MRRFLTRAVILRNLTALLIASALFIGIRHRRDFWDFEVYRTAGARVMAGEALYRPDDGHYQFKYWPAFAIVMAPFNLVPLTTAKFIWFVTSLVLLRAYFRRAIAWLPSRRSSARWLFWWTFVICAKYIVQELVNGQANVLMALLVFSAALFVQQQRPRWAGVLIGLAVFVKPYALLALPWLAVTAGLGAAMSAVSVIIAGLLLPATLYGWTANLAQLQAWYAVVTDTTAPNLLVPENVSFVSMWAKWLGEGPLALKLAVVTSVATIGTTALVWWRRWGDANNAYLEISLLLLAMPLLSPQGWDYVLLGALPAFVCLVDRFGQLSIPWRATAVVAVVLIGLTIYDLLGRHLYLTLMFHAVETVGAILLIAVLANIRWRRLA